MGKQEGYDEPWLPLRDLSSLLGWRRLHEAPMFNVYIGDYAYVVVDPWRYEWFPGQKVKEAFVSRTMAEHNAAWRLTIVAESGHRFYGKWHDEASLAIQELTTRLHETEQQSEEAAPVSEIDAPF